MRRVDEEAEDVLLLTRRYTMSDERGPRGGDDLPLHLTRRANDPVISPVSNGAAHVEPEVAPHQQEAPVFIAPREPEEPVLSEETRQASAAAFDRLHDVARADRSVPSILMPAPGRTLEDVIRELMRPLLKEWLDENLPEIVRSRVDEEVERIVRSRVR